MVDTGAGGISISSTNCLLSKTSTWAVSETLILRHPHIQWQCNVGSKEFTLKGLVVEMEQEEGFLIGYDLDTSTMKELLDLLL